MKFTAHHVARLLFMAATFIFASAALQANAQGAGSYPNKSIKIVVPFPPGGATDILARAIGFELQKAWGQTVVIENKPGAGGNTGADLVAKSPADGYTLIMATVGTHAINMSLYAKMPYDAVKDFEPVVLVAGVPNLLVVHPSVNAKTVRELTALAKSQPGKLNVASSGNGTSIHLSAELYKQMAGVDILHVPYKGSAPAVADLLGGQVQMMFDNMPVSLPHVKAGKLRALAVTSMTRSAALPDVPTMDEEGLKGFDATSWFGLLAPAGTPKDIVAKLNAASVKALASAEMRERLAAQGAEPMGNTPDQFAAFIKAEIDKWAKIVKASGARID
ncbi:MAG: tripartite tricarboxylate transporter substrate binding protein [Betaproteobacteria bacterium]|nr:tripartite tricarboxylate transporter substrate binding protein [Betaproteobacteria bacterium]